MSFSATAADAIAGLLAALATLLALPTLDKMPPNARFGAFVVPFALGACKTAACERG